ncbi:hypothetical protein BCR42DRAFT_397460 [Absidia repens]|uniref:LysM domain-containing protein n=1 Tax=Absidia repens TaxID=90262 RepID=A0A1X2I2S3_9FUNG|nr:hypothetical protein BCR42DRAFT_397460 [Absidia repens]
MISCATFSMLKKQQQLFLIMVLALFFLCNSVDAVDINVLYEFKGQTYGRGDTILNGYYSYGDCIPTVYSKHPAHTIVASAPAVCFIYQNAGCKGPVLDQRLNLNNFAMGDRMNIIKKGLSFVCIQTGKPKPYDPYDD